MKYKYTIQKPPCTIMIQGACSLLLQVIALLF
nr:MAG TPA: hypothetical protein [Caudoviricetes sp.]